MGCQYTWQADPAAGANWYVMVFDPATCVEGQFAAYYGQGPAGSGLFETGGCVVQFTAFTDAEGACGDELEIPPTDYQYWETETCAGTVCEPATFVATFSSGISTQSLSDTASDVGVAVAAAGALLLVALVASKGGAFIGRWVGRLFRGARA